MLKTVTMTGADDSVSPADLILISQRFPFVEWGILVSRRQQGNPRYPSLDWIKRLCASLASSPVKINLSLHMCGSFVREFLIGDDKVVSHLQPYWKHFQRVQLNTHGEGHEFTSEGARLINEHLSKEFIIQYDNINDHIIDHCHDYNVGNIAALFDLSHGAGIVPAEWPNKLSGIKCGYAGGLGPDNLESELKKIRWAADRDSGMFEYWIDMETKVRDYINNGTVENPSQGRDIFDLNKVRRCLEIAAPYVTQSTVPA
jgi:hypothetical protein